MTPRPFIVNFSLDGLADGSWMQLPAGLYKHAVLALRHDAGDRIVLRDDNNKSRTCTLEYRGDAMGIVLGPLEDASLGLAEPAITLAPALFKSQRFEWMLEKATELGATAIAPVETQRSVVRWRPERAEKKLRRWNKILREAARQSGAAVPDLAAPLPLSDMLERLGDEQQTLIYAEPSSSTSVRPGKGPVVVFTGPEGGFTPEELEMLEAAGASGVDLGPRILRAETAPLAVLTLLRLAHGT